MYRKYLQKDRTAAMIKVDLSEIEIEVTPEATAQVKLIAEHDYTVKDQVFRLKVDGKGCGGFDYALGFTPAEKDDLIYIVDEVPIHIDPFTAYYSKQGKLEYIVDFDNDQEGFFFTNYNEKKYRGKFFKDESMVPQES